MLELSCTEVETCAGWRAGRELEEQQSRRKNDFRLLVQAEQCSLRCREVSRRAGSTSVEGVKEDRNPATSKI